MTRLDHIRRTNNALLTRDAHLLVRDSPVTMNPALHAANGVVSSGAGGGQDGNTGAVFHQAAIAAEALSQQQHQHTQHEPGHEDQQEQRASPHAGHAPSAAVNANKKRRASGQPGSRGVANLTPEQLAKKRANDREAQRAIRERTKSTIDTLERRISELESQQPFQELQRVKQERDRALAECEELRRRLGVVRDVIGGSQPPGLNGEMPHNAFSPQLRKDADFLW